MKMKNDWLYFGSANKFPDNSALVQQERKKRKQLTKKLVAKLFFNVVN